MSNYESMRDIKKLEIKKALEIGRISERASKVATDISEVYKTIESLPGGLGSFMLRINPFEFPIGMPLSEHMTCLMQVFEGAFDLEAPFPMLLIEGIEEVYRKNGWFPENVSDGKRPYPNAG